jgi:Cro/C1-type HTH DNA-binding domain
MTIEDFISTPLVDLHAMTGVTSPRWSRYFSGHTLSERTISKIAEKLEMTPGELLTAVNERRQIYQHNS